ncbi:MAG: hypothetical protein ACPG9R_13245 [Marinobacter salsuginis]
MNETTEDKTASAPPPQKKGFSGLHVFGIVLLTIVATVGVGYWWLSHYVFPDNFDSYCLWIHLLHVLLDLRDND